MAEELNENEEYNNLDDLSEEARGKMIKLRGQINIMEAFYDKIKEFNTLNKNAKEFMATIVRFCEAKQYDEAFYLESVVIDTASTMATRRVEMRHIANDAQLEEDQGNILKESLTGVVQSMNEFSEFLDYYFKMRVGKTTKEASQQ